MRSAAIVSPSKVFLWALEKEESVEREYTRDESAASSATAASSHEKRYKSALQVYEVQASGLKLLYTYNDNDIKSKHKGTWISRIFTVTPLPLICVLLNPPPPPSHFILQSHIRR
jgi:hypothetical protein